MLISDYPRVLHVDTSYASPENYRTDIWDETLDYRIYNEIPTWWRRLEILIKMDFYLAFQAKKNAHRFDVILGGSENVGFPLILLKPDRPLVVTVYSISHPVRESIGKLTDISNHWSRIGVLVDAHKKFLVQKFAYPAEHIFRYLSAPIDVFTPIETVSDGSILSIGVARRDYPTLIAALEQLPECQTKIFAASRYFEIYKGGMPEELPGWIQIKTEYGMSTNKIADLYRSARFVVIPLKDSHQFAAGGSTVLEAMSTGKAVIASSTPGMRDFVKDGVTGFLVPPGDHVALREKIKLLWNDPALAHQMGKEGRKYAEEQYNPRILNNEMQKAVRGAYFERNR